MKEKLLFLFMLLILVSFGCTVPPTGSAPIISNVYLTDYQFEDILTEFTMGDSYYYGFTVYDEDLDAAGVKKIFRTIESSVDWISMRDAKPILLPEQDSVSMDLVIRYGVVFDEGGGWAPGTYSFALEVTDKEGHTAESDPVEFTILPL